MEIWDLYDKNRMLINQTMVRGNVPPENTYHIVIHVCIFNSDGNMLIQRRQPFKSKWPDLWDLSVGGSAIQGETSQAAAEREVHEEIGYDLSLEDVRPSLTINFDKGFDDIYLINRNLNLKELTLQEEEVKEIKWASLDEIKVMIDAEIFIPYHKGLIELLFFMKDQMKIHTR